MQRIKRGKISEAELIRNGYLLKESSKGGRKMDGGDDPVAELIDSKKHRPLTHEQAHAKHAHRKKQSDEPSPETGKPKRGA